MSRKFRFRVTRDGGSPDRAEEPFPAPDPALTDEERAIAEDEARRGVPASAAAAPSPGERRVESRFRQAMATVQARTTTALTRLGATVGGARHRAGQLEADAARERASSFADVDAACQRLESRYQRGRAAASELAGFRRARGIPDHVNPRPSSRGWIWLLLIVAFAETTANGILLHTASTEGIVSNWLFAALVTAMNVGLMGWLIGDLIARRMLGAPPRRKLLLAGALVPCALLAGVLHFGFAHYRDAVSALAASQTTAALDLGDIDAGVTTEVVDPHPPAPLSVEEAVIGELRAQFLWWTPGGEFTDHPAERAADDHSADVVRMAEAGGVGYRAEAGGLVRVEDALAGRFDGWRSVLLAGVGFAALLLAAWKWFGGREPIPHFGRLHEAREAAAQALDDDYQRAVATLAKDEHAHRARLAEAEQELVALGGRFEQLDAERRDALAREAEHLQRIAEAGVIAVEEYREVNRQQRLSSDPGPGFWAAPWQAEVVARESGEEARWRQQLAENLAPVMAAAERVRAANTAHAPVIAEAFAEARERLGQAARIPGARRRPPPQGKPPAPPDLRLVPGAAADRRLQAGPGA